MIDLKKENKILLSIILILIILMLLIFLIKKKDFFKDKNISVPLTLPRMFIKKINGNKKSNTYNLLLYFPGSGRTMKSIEDYLNQINKHCMEKKYNIIIASINGDYNNFNIQNLSSSAEAFHTGSGKNTENIDGCLDSNTTPPSPDQCENKYSNVCRWTNCQDEIKSVKNIINYFKNNYKINEVIAGGFSVGAMLCLNLLTSGLVKKIFTFSSNLPFGMKTCPADPNIKILDFHGIGDNTVPGITSGCCKLTPFSENQCNYEVKKQLDNTPGTNKQKCENMISKPLKSHMINVIKNEFNIAIKENELNKHYSCDGNWLYYNLHDLLSKISSSNNNFEIIKYDHFKKVITLLSKYKDPTDPNNGGQLKNIYKYSDNIYSIEWGGDGGGWHAIPGLYKDTENPCGSTCDYDTDNSVLPFLMGIDFLLD